MCDRMISKKNARTFWQADLDDVAKEAIITEANAIGF
jgi:hypothetical protein